MIAGEGLIGIILAILTVAGVAGKINLSGLLNTGLVGGIVLLVIMILCVVKFALPKKDNKNEK